MELVEKSRATKEENSDVQFTRRNPKLLKNEK